MQGMKVKRVAHRPPRDTCHRQREGRQKAPALGSAGGKRMVAESGKTPTSAQCCGTLTSSKEKRRETREERKGDDHGTT